MCCGVLCCVVFQRMFVIFSFRFFVFFSFFPLLPPPFAFSPSFFSFSKFSFLLFSIFLFFHLRVQMAQMDGVRWAFELLVVACAQRYCDNQEEYIRIQ